MKLAALRLSDMLSPGQVMLQVSNSEVELLAFKVEDVHVVALNAIVEQSGGAAVTKEQVVVAAKGLRAQMRNGTGHFNCGGGGRGAGILAGELQRRKGTWDLARFQAEQAQRREAERQAAQQQQVHVHQHQHMHAHQHRHLHIEGQPRESQQAPRHTGYQQQQQQQHHHHHQEQQQAVPAPPAPLMQLGGAPETAFMQPPLPPPPHQYSNQNQNPNQFPPPLLTQPVIANGGGAVPAEPNGPPGYG